LLPFQMVSIQLGRKANLTTKPRSRFAMCFFSGAKCHAIAPQSPIAGFPCLNCSHSFLFTTPASTIKATSRVSASVTRNPSTNSLFFPNWSSVRVKQLPAWTTSTRWRHSPGPKSRARTYAMWMRPQAPLHRFLLRWSLQSSSSFHPYIRFMFCTPVRQRL